MSNDDVSDNVVAFENRVDLRVFRDLGDDAGNSYREDHEDYENDLKFFEKTGCWKESFDPADFEDEEKTSYELWALPDAKQQKGGTVIFLTQAEPGSSQDEAMAEFREFIRNNKSSSWDFKNWKFFVLVEHVAMTRKKIDITISESLMHHGDND